jgi:putative ABC transport system permease protein
MEDYAASAKRNGLKLLQTIRAGSLARQPAWDHPNWVVFGVEASMIGSQVAQRTPQMLLLGARRQQQPPKASWGLMLLGLVCLGTAYDMALQFSREIALTMIPIVTLTIYGTYLLFSQAAVRVLTALRRPGIPGMRLLLIARLSHRMHDYARMLTVVTVLNAVVLTGMGTINGALQVFIAQSLHLTPFSLQLSTNAAHPTALRSAQVRQAIVDQHLTMQTVVDTPLVDGEVVQGEHHIPVSIMAFSDFLRMQEAERQAHPDLHENQQNVAPLTNDGVGHLATPDVAYGIAFERSQLVVNDLSVMMLLDTIEPRVLNTVFGIADDGPSTNVVVVTDAIYSRVMGSAQSEHRWTVSSFVLPNWQQSQPVVDVLHHRLPESQQVLLTDTVTNFTKGKQFFSVMLFADFFISGLFFLAAGSAIYFKLFTQQEEDRRQFHALERIGFQRREAARLLNREFLLLFLLPISLALVHSVVALIDLSNLMMSMLHGEKLFPNSGIMVIVLQAFVPVSLIYLGGFALYFWIARLSYLRRMQLATASPMKV